MIFSNALSIFLIQLIEVLNTKSTVGTQMIDNLSTKYIRKEPPGQGPNVANFLSAACISVLVLN